MDNNDKLTIERWKLKDVIETFRMLVATYPKIEEQKSCLDRRIIKSCAMLIYLYNGEHLTIEKLLEYGFGSIELPKIKED